MSEAQRPNRPPDRIEQFWYTTPGCPCCHRNGEYRRAWMATWLPQGDQKEAIYARDTYTPYNVNPDLYRQQEDGSFKLVGLH